MAENTLCSICLQDITQATMLECKHCFCFKCLADYSKKFTNETALKCPLCRKTIPIPECVVVAQTSKHEIRHGCDICEGGVNADFRCTDCCQNMCQSCKRMHDKLMTCRGHNVVDVGIGEAANRTGGGVAVAPVPEPKDLCPFHETTAVGFYCKDCRVGVCSRCFITDHNGHQYVDVEKDETFQNAKQELGALEKEIENKITQFQEFCKSLNARISKIAEIAETECLKVDCHIAKICKKLRQHGVELKNRVNESRDKEKLKIETLLREVRLLNQNLKSTNKNTVMVKEKNSVVQILDLIPKVKMMKTKSESQKLKVPVTRYVRFVEGCEDVISRCYKIGSTKDFLQVVNMVEIFNLGKIDNIGSTSVRSPLTPYVYGSSQKIAPSKGVSSSSMFGSSQNIAPSQGVSLASMFGSSQKIAPSQGVSLASMFGSSQKIGTSHDFGSTTGLKFPQCNIKSTIQGPWKLNVEHDADSNLVISLCLLSNGDSNMESRDIDFYCKLQNIINDDKSVIKRGEHSIHAGESGLEMLVVGGVFSPRKGFTDANGDFTVNCSIWTKQLQNNYKSNVLNRETKKPSSGRYK